MVGGDRGGIVTHQLFKPAYSVADLEDAAAAIDAWSRLSYGWPGRTPDDKAAFMATLGADPSFYAPFERSAEHWYREYATGGLFLNHVLVNPPIDRDKAVHEVADVCVHKVGETDAGIVVSGASYERNADSPWSYPLSSRFDENDAVVIFDDALMPWENVLVCGDVDKALGFFPARIFGTMAWPKVKQTFLQILGGSPLVMPSGPNDLTGDEVAPLVERFYRGSTGDAHGRVKLFEQCMADYDLEGWTAAPWADS